MSGVQGDGFTRAMMTIDYPHHEIHSGSHFFIRDVVDQAITTVFDLQITVPNTTKWIHMLWEVDAEAEMDMFIYENVVVGAAGSTVTPRNSNRNSNKTSGLIVKSQVNASVGDANADTATAAALEVEHLKAGSGANKGGSASREHEIILRQGSIYCFRGVFTKAGYMSFDLNWYEHTDGKKLSG